MCVGEGPQVSDLLQFPGLSGTPLCSRHRTVGPFYPTLIMERLCMSWEVFPCPLWDIWP